jgi:hypothetical protein
MVGKFAARGTNTPAMHFGELKYVNDNENHPCWNEMCEHLERLLIIKLII